MSLVSDLRTKEKKAGLPGVEKNTFSRSEAKRLGNDLGVDWQEVSVKDFRDGLNVERASPDKTASTIHELGNTALDRLKESQNYYRGKVKTASVVKRARREPDEWQKQLSRLHTATASRKQALNLKVK